MEANINEANYSNLALIKEMAEDIWPQYYGEIISMEQIHFMLSKLYNIDALAEAKRNGERFFIIYKGADPIGYFSIMPLANNEQIFKLPKLYLYPAYRGKGFGAQMLAFAENEAKKMGATELTLNVNRNNPSFEFYKKRGYAVAETVDIPFGSYYLNDYVMIKKLSNSV